MGRQFWIEADGHELAVQAYNEDAPGTPVVLIHGVLASVNFWHADHAPWLEGRRWYSLGLPVHYPSRPAPDFVDATVDDEFFFRIFSKALDKLLQNEEAIFVGHSTGGFTALNLASRGDRRVKAIVSVGGFARGKFGGVEGLLQRFSLMGPIGRVFYNLVLAAFASTPTICLWLSVPLASRWSAYMNWAGIKPTFEQFFPDTKKWFKRQMAHLFQGIWRLDILQQLKNVNVPVMVIAGETDPVIPFAHSRQLAEFLPNVDFRPLPKVGHMPFAEVSAEYNAMLQSFIRTHADK